MERVMIKWIIVWSLLWVCSGAPHRIQLPAYVIKFVALFPGSKGPLAFCDHNSTPKSRNPCDYRVHFDVLFPDDPDEIPYADLQFSLPNNRDYFVAESTALYWPKPLPKPSYPGEWQELTAAEYARILRNDAQNVPITFRITVFDRDDFGYDDVIAQESFSYTLNQVMAKREKVQLKYVTCKSGIKCTSLRVKFMFYLLDNEESR